MECWQTADHMVDCVLSYAMQIVARAHSGYLPFEELHAKSEPTPLDLIAGLRSVKLSTICPAASRSKVNVKTR